jgi:hypothetical protein
MNVFLTVVWVRRYGVIAVGECAFVTITGLLEYHLPLPSPPAGLPLPILGEGAVFEGVVAFQGDPGAVHCPTEGTVAIGSLDPKGQSGL